MADMATFIDTLKTRLTAKITGMLLGAMVFALVAIGYTLLLSWELEGAAAAINDSGSLRMRAWKMAAIINQAEGDAGLSDSQAAELQQTRDEFEQTLSGLSAGDPQRPLFLPRENHIRSNIRSLQTYWRDSFAPSLDRMLRERHIRPAAAAAHELATRHFVAQIHATVGLIEQEYARQTFWLRSSQMALIVLAICGSLVMIMLLHLMIVTPVTRLHQGLQRMSAGDFGVRLPVEGRDEFAQLAEGFNTMADELQQVYDRLEERVQEKTLRLAEKNRHLSVLYDISKDFNRPQSMEDMCALFMRRIVPEFGAAGGTVRLIDRSADRVYLVVEEGIPPTLSQQMQCQQLGSCFCTIAAQRGRTSVNHLNNRCAPNFSHCLEAGFAVVMAIPIRSSDKKLGIFNLHFMEDRHLGAEEVQLLEAMGQHLGIAIDNQRLAVQAKELAIVEERNLVAQGLHDSVVQSLSFLNLHLQLLKEAVGKGDFSQVAETIPLLQTGVQQGYEDLRELMGNFRTRHDETQLEAAIGAVIRRFTEQTAIPVDLKIDNSGAPLANEERLQILFILQEALSNIRKHAQATVVSVRVLNRADFDLTVTDNGIGFNPEAVLSSLHTHIGLKIMRERATRAHAELLLDSTPGQGTTLSLHLPREQRQKA
ncbi:MAG: type IV pili methyl-accepting chemotaxis transducer N-terminal domain-containing protein [Fluviicoccus sp.]|uniref:type IV pili methyl-accepting chemotaxis transducer N-terminal domain-containing protein n=1 Tax=Fluviicoccus sp. TaxID=2003552 RepID=UPI0027267F1E|nr:type IV pili methyl-accepting chemotaxis transducer N-terminal domain-containing protein [Fluviicoccus sp.]MDO8331124.1 type IV pili methyl-accepting chemotaxis transducer N-terminal domain-containing protein [Fluviicoccus sp.]